MLILEYFDNVTVPSRQIDPELAMPEVLPFLERRNKSFKRNYNWNDGCRFLAGRAHILRQGRPLWVRKANLLLITNIWPIVKLMEW